MIFKIGDKVKFKNEPGGGIVTKIDNNGNIFVEVEGIDYPYSPHQLIAVSENNEVRHVVDKNKIKKTIAQTPKGNTNTGTLRKHAVNSNRKHNAVVEIDLHIEELVQCPEKLTPSQKLQKQIQCVKNCINDAKFEKIRKFVFIHGKGTGVLRLELINYLRTLEQDGVTFRDADYNTYGGGAIEVIVKL